MTFFAPANPDWSSSPLEPDQKFQVYTKNENDEENDILKDV